MKIYTLTKLVKFGSAYEIANEICKINNCFDHVKDIADTIHNEHGFDVTMVNRGIFTDDDVCLALDYLKKNVDNLK